MSRIDGPPPLDNAALRDLYKIAVEEYRFTVSLQADRQKFFIGLNLAVSSVVPAVAKLDVAEGSGKMLAGVLALAAMTALLGMLVVHSSHRYYRNARSQFQEVERRLGLHEQGLGLLTTPGMRDQRSGASADPHVSSPELPKVYNVVQFLLAALMVFDVWAAFLIWPE